MFQSYKNRNLFNRGFAFYSTFVAILFSSNSISSQELPQIITNKKIAVQNYLPDFSYAGYHFGETSEMFGNRFEIAAAVYKKGTYTASLRYNLQNHFLYLLLQ